MSCFLKSLLTPHVWFFSRIPNTCHFPTPTTNHSQIPTAGPNFNLVLMLAIQSQHRPHSLRSQSPRPPPFYTTLFLKIYLFLAALVLRCCVRAFSSCHEQASHCSGLSCCRAQALGVAAGGLNCSSRLPAFQMPTTNEVPGLLTLLTTNSRADLPQVWQVTRTTHRSQENALLIMTGLLQRLQTNSQLEKNAQSKVQSIGSEAQSFHALSRGHHLPSRSFYSPTQKLSESPGSRIFTLRSLASLSSPAVRGWD